MDTKSWNSAPHGGIEAAAPGFFGRAARRAWRALGNPVALRELRRTVRSKLVAVAFCLYLAVLAVACPVAAKSSEAFGMLEMQPGAVVAIAISFALSNICGFWIPLWAGIRTMMDFNPGKLDVEFSTGLAPVDMVDGRLIACCALAILAAFAATPFLALAVLLRGVSYSMIPVMAFSSVLQCLVASALAVAIGSGGSSKILRGFLLFISLSTIESFVRMVVPALAAMRAMWSASPAGIMAAAPGPGLAHATPGGAAVAAAGVAAALFFAALMRALAARKFSPPHTDYLRPLVLTQLAIWALSLAVSFATAGAGDPPAIFLACGLCVSAMMFTAGCSCRFTPRRIRAAAPEGFWGRLATFPLHTGAEQMWTLSIAVAAATSAVSLAWVYWPSAMPGANADPVWIAILVFFSYCVAMYSGRLAWDRALNRRPPPAPVCAAHVVALGIIALVVLKMLGAGGVAGMFGIIGVPLAPPFIISVYRAFRAYRRAPQ